MHVVWKRPDGFHGADPADFTVVHLKGNTKLWLHRRDQTHFPFWISGGWQEEEQTAKLNSLVNLLGHSDSEWVTTLLKIFNDSLGDDASKQIDDLMTWVEELRLHLKGDKWEIEIMSEVFSEVTRRIRDVKGPVTKALGLHGT